MNNGFIKFENVARSYNMGDVTIKAVDGINFTLDEGKFSIIVGPSGAGKSTVLNILGGMDFATSGKITVGGSVITEFNRKKRAAYRRNDVGFVFQFYNLIQNLTALENVELASFLNSNALNSRAVLNDVGLAERINNFPAQLSGGEQQRVAIARALAKNPKLLLCDEPTGALDYETGKEILKILQETCKNKNVTLVVITHNSAITPIADRVIKIKSGKVESITDNDNPTSIDSIEW